MSVSEEKAVLRRLAAGLPRMECAGLLDRFLALPQVAAADTVLLFYGTGLEPDTRPVLQKLLEMGKRPVLPVCLPGRQMEMRLYCGENRLKCSRYGIPEPDESCPVVLPEEIGAALIPHILCDRDGYRLGHGGGYYDRWLEHWSGFSAAVCPPERLVVCLPRDQYDRPLQCVITELPSA